MNAEITDEVLQQLNELRRLTRQVKPVIDPLHGQGYVLYHLCHRGGQALPGELSAALGMTTPRMTSILTSLERQGLLSRAMSPTDRRKIIVTATDKGRALVREHDAQSRAEVEAYLDALGEEDAAHCLRILQKTLRYKRAVPTSDSEQD